MNRPNYLLAVSMLVLLSACSGDDVRSTIGLERSAPDEFRVVSRPPLSVPPEFTLRPPAAGEDEIALLPTDQLTRSMITGTTATFDNAPLTKADGSPVVDTAILPVESGSAPSGAESELLTKLGADQKETGIRDKLFEDSVVKQKEKEDEWFSVDALNPFAKDKDALDAKEEVKKLKDESKPVLGKHLVLEDEKKEEAKPAEVVEEKNEEPAKETPAEKPVVTPPPAAPVAVAPVPTKTEAPKPVTLKDVLNKKKAEKTEENLEPVTVPDKKGDSLINLDMPEAIEDSKPEEPVAASEVKLSQPEPTKAPAPDAPQKTERKMPLKIIKK